MSGGGGKRAITAFGILTVTFWLSRAVFPQPIPPVGPLPNIEGLLGEISAWIREAVPSLNRPDREVIASFRRELLGTYILAWLTIATGVASGVLTARRRRAGRWLAIALCGGLLARVLFDQGRMIWEHQFIRHWTAAVQWVPRLFVRAILDVVFYGATLVYLTRRPVAGLFFRSGAGSVSRH